MVIVEHPQFDDLQNASSGSNVHGFSAGKRLAYKFYRLAAAA